MKITTLKDLKDFLNSLDDVQLGQEAVLSVLDYGTHKITDCVSTTEDEYLTDEGFAPISIFEPEFEGDNVNNYDLRLAPYVYLISA